MTWEKYIKQQVDTLTIDQIQHYFQKKYRGRFYVDMKRLVAFALHEKGFSYCKISKILHGKSSYSCTNVLLKGLDYNQIDDRVFSYFAIWIGLDVYPKTTVNKRAPETDFERKLNVDSIHYSDFKLVKHGDL